MNTLIFDQNSNRDISPNISKIVFVIATSWFALILATALSGGFYASDGERPLTLLLAIALPVVVFGIAYSSSRDFREWALALDMRRLILLHSWRMIGIGFVFLYFYDRLPAVFAFPAGIGDAMTAVAALFLGIALYENASAITANRVFLWNTFGLVDFFVAIATGVLARTGDVLHFAGHPASDIMGDFPLAMIPGFAVPFFMITHLIIYMQLRQR